MPVFIAMLRGINIGPHKRMKMEKLRASCQALGFDKVQTFIQSGNVVFQAAQMSSPVVSKKLEARIVTDFGFSADVIARTQDEMKKIVKNNPFLKDPSLDPAKFHVVFLSEKPQAAALKRLETLTLAPDKLRHSGKEIYFYFPNGVSGSSVWKHPLDRVLSVTSTMRNWNTVNSLYEMAAQCG
jgi:uncharacterized protein (DUF1697 family)